MENELMFRLILVLISAVGAFGLTCAVMAVLLPRLRKYKLNQPISIYAPKSHSTKGKTPTLGGLAFVLASLIVMILLTVGFVLTRRTEGLIPLWCSFGLALANAAIGFVDDYNKLVKKHNVGLRAWQKFLLQLIVGAIYLVLMVKFGTFTTVLHIPFTEYTVDFGIFAYVIAILLITGITNSTNLTDGVDGLLSSTAAVVATFFLAIAMWRVETIPSIIPALILGSVLAFLIFNAHPAKVFMGDTGSLFIGGAFVGTAFLLNEPLIVLIAGGIYVIETGSVILQVISAKMVKRGLRKKRFFLRTPIHHHFEDMGWGENKIVISFVLVSLVCCLLAFLGVK